MPIYSNEIVFRKAEVTSSDGSNGGRMTWTEIVSGAKNQVWPDVRRTEIETGQTLYRKMFLHVNNDDDIVLADARIFLTRPTPGGDHCFIAKGTQTDTQSAIGTLNWYGSAFLAVNAAATDTTITVDVEDAADETIFRDGDMIRISDKATLDATDGNTEFHTIAINGVGTPSGNRIVLTITKGLTNSFSATNTYVSSVIEAGDVQGVASTPTVTSVAGTFNHAAYPVLVDWMGAIQQTVTITFSSATAFSVSGDTVGAMGTGTISADFIPINAARNKPYFRIRKEAWGGTFAQNNTVVFTITPASVPLWAKRVVPIGAVIGNNFMEIGLDAESAQ